jgi:Ca2+-binding RTX toxin-like protein
MAKFVFKSSVNTDKFDYAALINGTFSDQTDTSFTVSSGNDVINVMGQGFLYSNGSPIDGTIEAFNLKTDGAAVIKASALELPVPQLATDLADQNAKALQEDVFGGKDLFVGSDQHDSIYGFGGNDNIRGHGGADLIVGGRGTDHLHGDEGGDTFRFESIADSRVKAPDTIFDLGGNDRIDLHKIDADVTQDGDQAFTLVDNFTGHAGQMTLSYNPELDRTSLAMDVDGDGTADSVIYMMGDQTGFDGIVA